MNPSKAIRRIRLIHWNKAEAKAKAEKIQGAGYKVDSDPFDGPPALRTLREHPPAAVVIDLSRSPSAGRDVGIAIRHYASTRPVPLVFVGGDPEKVARIQKLLPDAVYVSWSRIRSSLKRAIANPPKDPAVPKSLLEGYSGTPLPKKLGLKPNSVVALINAPHGFDVTLGQLPRGVTIRKQARDQCDLVIWFTQSRNDLEGRIERIIDIVAEKGGLWIAWPKKASGVVSDLSQRDVREVGLASGLVDYKVCAINNTWSGLLFSRRKSK